MTKPIIKKVSKQEVLNLTANNKAPYLNEINRLNEGEGIIVNSREFQRNMNIKSIKNIATFVNSLGKTIKSKLSVKKLNRSNYLIYKNN